MKEQLKRRALDLVFLLVAAAVGVGAYYVVSVVRRHNEMDRAIIELIRANTPRSAVEPPVSPAPEVP